MRRPLLLTITALGALVCLVGSTGLFAALTDTARTGPNQVVTGGLAPSADIKLATAVFSGGSYTCGTFEDDLLTPAITETDLAPGSGGSAFFCLENVGSQALGSLHVMVDELVDVDHACTGDEADNGDTTCGGDLLGELSGVLSARWTSNACDTGVEQWATAEVSLLANSTTPEALPTLGIGETMCLQVYVAYRVPPLAADIQKAQSDTVTWRFKFTGQT